MKSIYSLRTPVVYYFFCFAVIFSGLISCDSEVEFYDPDEEVSLEIRVTGTLSGNPRDGLKVCVYESREDAEEEVNPITTIQRTNDDGVVYFSGFEQARRYFVRVDALLAKHINESPMLWPGENKMTMTIL